MSFRQIVSKLVSDSKTINDPVFSIKSLLEKDFKNEEKSRYS